jgi:hypothetical protein
MHFLICWCFPFCTIGVIVVFSEHNQTIFIMDGKIDENTFDDL